MLNQTGYTVHGGMNRAWVFCSSIMGKACVYIAINSELFLKAKY